jgi:hypothetical protein
MGHRNLTIFKPFSSARQRKRGESVLILDIEGLPDQPERVLVGMAETAWFCPEGISAQAS